MVYRGLGETEEKIYEDTSMLRKTQPHYTCCFIWVQPNVEVRVSRGKGAILALRNYGFAARIHTVSLETAGTK